MKKIIFFFILSIFISCQTSRKTKLSSQKKWIYLETISYDKKSSHALYGEISISYLEQIKENSNLEEYIIITNARYNDENNGVVKSFSEENEDIEIGTFYFKINNIEYLEILKRDPLNKKVKLVDEGE